MFDISLKDNTKAPSSKSKVSNKYSYQVENHDMKESDNTVVTFVPSETSEKSTKHRHHHHKKENNKKKHIEKKNDEKKATNDKKKDVSADNDDKDGLLSAVKLAAPKVRSGYHSSTGPGDFMRKKYTSNLLSVSCSMILSGFILRLWSTYFNYRKPLTYISRNKTQRIYYIKKY